VTGLPGEPGAWSADGQVCTLCAVDIAGFTRPDRDEETQSHLRHTLHAIVREGFSASGIPWGQCPQQDRGDGLLVILPPAIPPHMITGLFPERLRHLIGRHNRFAVAAARIQVRAALNIGPVYRDEQGYSGEDVNLLCRMLDSRPLRRQLADTGTELALMVSARVHDTVVMRHPSLVDPGAFKPVRTRVKWTRIDAWIYAPGDRLLQAPSARARRDAADKSSPVRP
jgi:hypothetical protein